MTESLITVGLMLILQYLAYRHGRRVEQQKWSKTPFEILRYYKRSADEMLKQAIGSTEVELNLHVGGEALECNSKLELAQLSLAIGEVLKCIKPVSHVSSEETA